MTAWLTLVLASADARAGGGGAYVDIQAGAGWSDATGPLIRGKSYSSSLGAFWGDYHGTFRYGRYYRLGAWYRVNENDRDVLTDTTYSTGVEFGRGVDLLNVGIWWLTGVGPVLTDPSVDGPISYGAVLRGSIGGMWNPYGWLGVSLRIEGGLQYLDDHVSVVGGFGLSGLIRNHMSRTGWSKRDPEAPEPVVEFGDLTPAAEPTDPLATP
jgi:hypothetical protein